MSITRSKGHRCIVCGKPEHLVSYLYWVEGNYYCTHHRPDVDEDFLDGLMEILEDDLSFDVGPIESIS